MSPPKWHAFVSTFQPAPSGPAAWGVFLVRQSGVLEKLEAAAMVGATKAAPLQAPITTAAVAITAGALAALRLLERRPESAGAWLWLPSESHWLEWQTMGAHADPVGNSWLEEAGAKVAALKASVGYMPSIAQSPHQRSAHKVARLHFEWWQKRTGGGS